MAVNCSNRIKKNWKSALLPGSPAFCISLKYFPPSHCFYHPFFWLYLFTGFFNLLFKLGLPPHHGFCFLSQVHVAQIQIATGREGPSAGPAGQPSLQAGVWGQNQQPPARSGRALQAAVKRSFSNLFSGLFLLCVDKSRQGSSKRRKGLQAERRDVFLIPGDINSGEVCETARLLTWVSLKLKCWKCDCKEMPNKKTNHWVVSRTHKQKHKSLWQGNIRNRLQNISWVEMKRQDILFEYRNFHGCFLHFGHLPRTISGSASEVGGWRSRQSTKCVWEAWSVLDVHQGAIAG